MAQDGRGRGGLFMLLALVSIEVLTNASGVLTNLISNTFTGKWTKSPGLLLSLLGVVIFLTVSLKFAFEHKYRSDSAQRPKLDETTTIAPYRPPNPDTFPDRGGWTRGYDGTGAFVEPAEPRDFTSRRAHVRRGSLARAFGAALTDASIVAVWPAILIWPAALFGAFGTPQFLGPVKENVRTLFYPFIVSALVTMMIVVLLDLPPFRIGGRVLAGWGFVPPLSFLIASAAAAIVSVIGGFTGWDFRYHLPLHSKLLWTSCFTPVIWLVVCEVSDRIKYRAEAAIVAVGLVFGISIFFSG